MSKIIVASEAILFLLVFFTGLLIRLYLADRGSFFGDVIGYNYRWLREIENNGVLSIYGSNLPGLYPPLYYYMLSLQLFLFNQATFSVLLFMKFLPILFDVFSFFALLLFGVSILNIPFCKSLLVSAIFFLNPAIMFNSSIWGQTDSLFSFFALLSVMALLSRRWEISMAALSLSLLVKPTALMVAPAIFLILVRSASVKRIVASAVTFFGVFFAGIAPFALNGDLMRFIMKMREHFSKNNLVSANAFNLWLLAPESFSSAAVFVTLEKALPILLMLFLLFLAAKEGVQRRFVPLIITWGFTFFMFGFGMHERYYHVILVIASLGLLLSRSLDKIYALLTLSYFVNMFFVFMLFEATAAPFYNLLKSLSPPAASAIIICNLYILYLMMHNLFLESSRASV